jgi:DNA-binding NtrC family response regulator
MAAILVVEDEPAILILMESVLKHAGYETLSASTLAEAQSVIQSEQEFDLVFTDINLADQLEGGLQVGQSVRQARPGTPVLYTSGRGLTDGMKSLFADPSEFLPKPYTDEQLVEAISRLLRKQ